MKRTITCLLIALFVFTFSACGNLNADTVPPSPSADNDTEEINDSPPPDQAGDEREIAAPNEIAQNAVSESELVGLTLFGHDLTDSNFLESYILASSSGAEYAVTVISAGSGQANAPRQVMWDYQAFTMIWNLWNLLYDAEGFVFDDVEDAHGILASRLADAIASFNAIVDGGIPITAFPFRVSADGQSASVGFETEIMGESLVILYFAQAIPDSDYILSVELMLWMGRWREEDATILEELSRHMGIDLAAYLP